MKFKNYILFFLFSVLILSADAQVTRNYQVIIRSNTGSITLWDGAVTPIWGFAPTLSAQPTLPARTLYANEGDTVIIYAKSISQHEHHTIHLHGLDVDTRNDGDPATSFWLSHMQDTTYTFYAAHAGTYLYHCHVADVIHQQMGMYGFVVVKAAGGVNTAWTGGPAFDKDYKWMLSEIDRSWHDTIPVHDTLVDTVHVPPYVPDYFLVNGGSKQQIKANDSTKITGSVGSKIYVRIGNMGFYNDEIIFPATLHAVIIDSDGRPLPVSISSDTLNVSPGERYGVMFSPLTEFTDSVTINYSSMNTGVVGGTEFVPVDISGFIGVNELKSRAEVKVFPNPVNSELTIISADSEISACEFYNAIGQDISKNTEIVKVARSQWKVNVRDLDPGIYFVKYYTAKGEQGIAKFSVVR